MGGSRIERGIIGAAFTLPSWNFEVLNDLCTRSIRPTGRTPRIIPRAEHSISRAAISPNALRVLYRLREAGYQAFLVGGCVRDLLLGISRKTSTSPPARCRKRSNALFRNCRLIGRRFRLAHVFFGREIIEVATFRAHERPGRRRSRTGAADLDDDATPDDARRPRRRDRRRSRREHDARRGRAAPDRHSWRLAAARARSLASRRRGRRSTTTIASSTSTAASCATTSTATSTTTSGAATSPPTRSTTTSPTSRSGTTPAASKTSPRDACRLIGDPDTRYREDPVRMLRAARFEAKLGFTLDGDDRQRRSPSCATCSAQRAAGAAVRRDAQAVPHRPRRVKSSKCCAAAACSPSCCPRSATLPGRASRTALVEKLLVAGPGQHRRARAGGQAGDADFPVRAAAVRADRRDHREAAAGAVARHRHHPRCACDRAMREAQGRISIPKRFSLGVREMFALQPRLEHPRGRRALRMIEQPRFRAGLRPAAAARRAWAWRIARNRSSGGRACRKCRRPTASAWRMRSALAASAAAARPRRPWRRRRRGRGRRPRPQAPPSAAASGP